MFYSYSKTEIKFKNITNKFILINGLILVVIGLGSFAYGRLNHIDNLSDYEKELLLIDMTKRNFNESEFINLMKELNIKFPHIVLAQAKTETGNYSSRIFRENHNLFGMKQAQVRVNTAKGTQYGHAYYNNWEESVYDYAFFQCRYLGAIRSEAEYFAYLAGNYAEDPNYVSKLKKLIEQEKLRNKF